MSLAAAKSPTSSMSALQEFRRGWPTVLGAMIGVGAGVAALPFYTAGAFMVPLERSLGWSRTDLSLGLSASTLTLVLGAPAAGRLADRFGARWVAAVSLLILCLGFLALSQVRGHSWVYIAVMGGMSLLAAGSSPVTFTRAVSIAFQRNRGLALGLTLMGMGVAGALGPAYVERLISTNGWRAGYIGLAGVVAAATPLVVLLLRQDRPPPAARRPTQRRPQTNTWRRGKPFWLLAAAFFLIALAQSGPIAHFIPMLEDAGRSPADAAKAAGLIGVSVVLGRLVTGWALDRVFGPLVAVTVFALTGAGCLIAGLSGGQAALVIAPLLGFSLGADVDLLAYLASRYFGLNVYGQVYGLLYGAFSLGAAAGPVVAGLVHDRIGTYAPSLVASAIVMGGACILLAKLGPYPDDADTPDVALEQAVR